MRRVGLAPEAAGRLLGALFSSLVSERSGAARLGRLPVRSLLVLLLVLPACAPVAAPITASAPAPIAASIVAPEASPRGPAASTRTHDTEQDTITIAAFNIQVFGRSKREKTEVMEVLTSFAGEVDVLLVQEIRDSSELTAGFFLEAINNSADREYAMYEGPRLGRTSSKEQYAVYYATDRARLIDAYTLADPDDAFEREPVVATFRSGNFDFSVVGCHIKPDDAERELRALSAAVDEIVAANPGERDVIILGDLNADGSYLDESLLTEIFPIDSYHVAISNDVDTMTTSDNTYDRIILRRETATHEYIAASAEVFEFDRAYEIEDDRLVRSVSDHYPVLARFRTSASDDDGS
ncbi:MAG: endonuclease [Myxococcales bacterium]|nr:MAG: endonuclease [Myxococcales bacterium]